MPSPQPQSHSLSKSDAKPTLFDDGWSSALPTNGPEPNQLTLLLVDDATDGLGAGAGRLLGRGAPVSRHCCHSQANPSRTGLL